MHAYDILTPESYLLFCKTVRHFHILFASRYLYKFTTHSENTSEFRRKLIQICDATTAYSEIQPQLLWSLSTQMSLCRISHGQNGNHERL